MPLSAQMKKKISEKIFKRNETLIMTVDDLELRAYSESIKVKMKMSQESLEAQIIIIINRNLK